MLPFVSACSIHFSFFPAKVLQRLKRDVPDARSKVTAVRGDLALPDLGLSKADMATIIAEVSVVFHLAATVRFHDSLKRMVQLNVMGTRSMVNICRQMPNLCVSHLALSTDNDIFAMSRQWRSCWAFYQMCLAIMQPLKASPLHLQAFVHVSTAYSNWSRREVQEMVYPAPIDAESLIAITESLSEKVVESMSELQFGQPNNYALSKAVAESLLLDKQRELPLAIVRPSIVTASWKEPYPHGFFSGCSTTTKLVSYVVQISTPVKRPTQLKVYNCTSSAFQTHTWGEVLAQVKRITVQFPLPNVVRAPGVMVTTSKVLYRLSLFFRCYVPAFFGDLALRLTGKKASFVAKYRKAISGMDATSFYTTNSWLFRSDNVMELMNDMSPTDKQLFDIDVRKLDWCQYWDNYMLGIRKYLFNVEDTELQQGRENV
ncbi:fatty acyl-CoA reductase 1-like [Dermacentor andersoni]|uniref:fatty acyl-CoA reductase 1-like n=1 Tax=Dermacentor andersoni TaxID=34620 RepID=UPI003B3A2838